jgi:Dyp-type peroxidase family
MAIDLETVTAHDPATLKDALKKMQGNILKGHGREHTVHIFVKFTEPDVKKLRAGLIKVTGGYVTSGWKQLNERDTFKKYKIPGAMFGNFFLTKKGYEKLGFTEIGDSLSDQHFNSGMTADTEFLSDPLPDQWEAGYNGGIDAMYLLADDDKDFLLRRSRDFLNEIETFCEVMVIERGDALRDPVTNEGIEHFGYVDGRSQPIYLSIDMPNEGTTNIWNPKEPLKRVLVKDESVTGSDHFGSYFVFRKLEQNVRDFKKAEEDLADELGFQTPEERSRAGAMAVGRFRDGTPVVLSQTHGFVPAKENDFDYAGDDDNNGAPDAGLKCPYQAHIRKTNPRGDLVRRFGGGDPTSEEGLERIRRITRRGIPFGERVLHPNDPQTISELPSGGVGLLFMCFQSSIEDQFAFMQHSWANDESFVDNVGGGDKKAGLDPIIGQFPPHDGPNDDQPVKQKWPAKYGPPADPDPAKTPEFGFEGFVKMKGGEYFFAPCMAFLQSFAPPA